MIFPSRASDFTRSRNTSPVVTSSPDNGSSKTKMSGLCSSAAEISTFCRIPFEYDPIGECRAAPSENNCSRSSIFRSSDFFGKPAQPPHQLQILAPCQMRIKMRLLRNIPQPPLVFDQLRLNAAPLKQHLAARRLQQAR